MVGGNFICLREKWYIIYLFIYYKIVYLVYRSFLMVYFAQGGTCVPVPPSLSSWRHFFCSLPALPMVVGGGGRVYA